MVTRSGSANPQRPGQSSRYRAGARLVAGAVTVLATEAAAQEFCVACTGPDAVYRCVIDQAVPQGIPLKMLCLGTLAKQGAHATCAVRGGTVFDCNGPIRRIDARAANQALAPPPAPASAPGQPGAASAPVAAGGQALPGQPDQQPKAPPPEEPPKTVEELAKRVSKSSGENLGKAGSAISNSTAKAWGCLTSLFKSC